MNKYQIVFRERLRETRERWANDPDGAPNADVYRLVHSIKGTAAMIGLDDWSETAARLLTELDEEAEKRWTAVELDELLAPFRIGEGEPDAARHLAAAETAVAVSAEAADAVAVRPERYAGDGKPHEPLVLLVDDDVSLLALLKDKLQQAGMHVLATPHAAQAIRLLYESKPDCLVLDVRLEETDGFEVLADVRRQPAFALVPTVMMSASDTKETRIRCYASGADDFAAKPVDPEELVARIGRQLQRSALVRRLVRVDELTGAYKDDMWRPAFRREAEASKRYGVPFSLVCLDIDRFRGINETYGHLDGDALLVAFHDAICASFPGNATLARVGTDRFFAVVPNAGADEALAAAERALRSFAETERKARSGETYRATGSAGIVEAGAASAIGADVDECADAAVRMLLAAKGEGGGRCAVARSVAGERVPARTERIAVVDDDPLLCGMLELQLRGVCGDETDPDIRVFPDGEAFLTDPWHDDPGGCVVVLDRMMPRMNGTEVLRRLRAKPNPGRYYIMMLTGDDDERHIAEAIGSGADDYMTKPFRLEELKSRIRRRLRRADGP
ncbi:response regulator [Paenibacillus flagellatus]|nr:response regulator [Paenibacillus flagellatus]